MNGKQRSPRRRFDSASLIPPEEGAPSDLPAEPLPADQTAGDPGVAGRDAPIVLLPIGKVEEELLKVVIPMVTQTFGRHVVIAKPLPVPKYAYNPTREQYHSAAILKRVESMLQDDWGAAVGVSDVDLFVPEVPFVFGEADRSTRSGSVTCVPLTASTPISKIAGESGALGPKSRTKALGRQRLIRSSKV